jgi:hypothetical protein
VSFRIFSHASPCVYNKHCLQRWLNIEPAITKNGITRLAAPPTPDLSKYKTDKKITDEEILQILEQPISKVSSSKSKNKKKKKKAVKKAEDDEDEEESSDEE